MSKRDSRRGLRERLWDIQPDRDWRALVHERPDDEESKSYGVLEKHLELLLEEIQAEYSEVHSAYASITGIQPGKYIAVAAVSRNLEDIPACSQDKVDSLISQILKDNTDGPVNVIRDPSNNPTYIGDISTKSKIVIKLLANEDLFGFISLDTTGELYFPASLVDDLNDLQPFLSRIIAETVFSMRLWDLAKPLQNNEIRSYSDLCEDITERALLSFGASGCILRSYSSPSRENLDEAHLAYTDEQSEQVVGNLLENDSVGSKICNLVMQAKNYEWSLGRIGQRSDENIYGLRIPKNLEDELKELGICSYSVFKLETTNSDTLENDKIGTLSIFHLHPKGYSWRDIALARQLVKRAADVIALHRQQAELIQTKDDLLEANELLELEGQMSTRAEIVTLLSHDLGHKALAVEGWFEEYTDRVKRALREKRSFPSIEKETTDGTAAIQSLVAGMNTVNKLFRTSASASKEKDAFYLREVIDNVASTLKSAMNRNDCKVRHDLENRDLGIYGNRNVFLLVIFNLFINSIDAQKSRNRRRAMTIRISCVIKKSGRLVISYNDDGPGINRSHFPHADDIFKLGSTNKEKGTGRGLTISRNLIGQIFGGELILRDPERAHFQILIPKNRVKK